MWEEVRESGIQGRAYRGSRVRSTTMGPGARVASGAGGAGVAFGFGFAVAFLPAT